MMVSIDPGVLASIITAQCPSQARTDSAARPNK